MEKNYLNDSFMRWSVVQRLEFIEFRLVWEGRINRSDIAKRFGVTVQQASADLGQYEQLAPANMLYLRGPKTFVPTLTFEPKFLRENADRYLLQMAAICAGHVDQQDTWFDLLPSMAAVPMPIHHVDTKLMVVVLRAVREKLSIEMTYQSTDRPELLSRAIEPHALGHDGVRWHVRAFCPRNNDFRDFVLARIEEARIGPSALIDPALDVEWNDKVTLILVPNPKLKDAVKRVVAKEYGMDRGKLRLKMRAALAFYAIAHMNLDIEIEPPERKRLVLTNLEEVRAAVRSAKAACLIPRPTI